MPAARNCDCVANRKRDSTVLMGENESGGVSKTDAPEIDVNAVPATGVEEAIIVVGIGGVG